MITIRQNICFRNPIIPNRKNPSCCSLHPPNTRKLHKNILCCSSSSSPEEETNNGSININNEEKHKLGVVVKAMKRPNVVLKLMWMEKNIGIAIEQVIPGGKGTIPLSPYYFWPRKDACEELKVLLEGKPWISHKQVALLLNQAANIINLWQQRNGAC